MIDHVFDALRVGCWFFAGWAVGVGSNWWLASLVALCVLAFAHGFVTAMMRDTR
jgi:hypothetical protein